MENPYFVIAYRTTADFTTSVSEVKKAIYSQFYKQVQFEFMDLAEESDINQKIIKQGIKIV